MVTLKIFALAVALSAPNDAVLLEFSAPWCGPCRSMQPTVEKLARDGYSVQQIDVDLRPDLAKQYRITGLPTFVMVAGGHEVDRIVGPCEYQRLQRLFPQHASWSDLKTSPRLSDHSGFWIRSIWNLVRAARMY